MSIINDALKKVQKSIDNSVSSEPDTTRTRPPIGRDEDLSILPAPRLDKALLNTDTTLPIKIPVTKPPRTVPDKPAPAPSQPSVIGTSFFIPEQKKYQRTLMALCGAICAILILLIGYLSYIFSTTRANPNAFGARHGSSNRFVLQGIMTRDDKNVALINNELYEAGETVMGRKILDISVNTVKILDRDKIKTLKVHKK